ncbi:MAG: radical SAM protein, partial [Planctomycetota bacterium]
MGDFPLPDPFGLAFGPFCDAVREHGFGRGHAEAAYNAVFREGVLEPRADRGRMVARGRPAPIVREVSEEVAEGVTTKFVQRLDAPDHKSGAPHLDIESVVIPMVGRTGTRTHTLCVSSQVGCAMGCTFCETAQMGLVRSLTAEEIVGQWWAATHVKGVRVDNIVFMGMGEPLDNAAEVIRAISVLAEHQGPSVPMSRITISTVGRVDGLRLLDGVVKQHGWKRLGLAVSVNAPNDDVRSEIMPINRRYDMAELREALLSFRRGSHRKVCFEYVLIPGVNDREEHARELSAYLDPFKAGRNGRSPTGLVNVIPYNPRRDSPWPAPAEEDVA